MLMPLLWLYLEGWHGVGENDLFDFVFYFFFSFPEEQNIAKLHKHLVIFDYDESPKET